MDELGHMLDALTTQGYLRVAARPGRQQNSISGFDSSKNAFLIDLKVPARENKANEELVKFISRALKRPVRIKSGHTSRIKVLI